MVKEELKNAKSEHFEICRKFRDAKNYICEIFGRDEGEKIIFKHRKHYLKVMQIRNRKIEKKLTRDGYKGKKDEIVENKDLDLPSLYIETDFSKKKKRKFKRKFNQPKPKKERKIDKNGRQNKLIKVMNLRVMLLKMTNLRIKSLRKRNLICLKRVKKREKMKI